MRWRTATKLEESNETPRCDCGWLRPKFVEVTTDKNQSLAKETFMLQFDCPQCGKRWKATYGKIS